MVIKAKNAGYRAAKEPCTEASGNPKAKAMCNTAVNTIPTLPITKKGGKRFMVFLFKIAVIFRRPGPL